MKLLLVAHGYPPELVGGTELSVQALARGLSGRGHEVVVVAGSMDYSAGFRTTETVDVDPASDSRVRVRRIHRADLYFDHWQKSRHPATGRAFEAIVAEERPDVVHVHHWIRLTRDLVERAARAGAPAVVHLHDAWSTCLITFRVRTGTEEFCEAPLAANPCLGCAGAHPPRTPWVPVEAAHMAIHQYRADIQRELLLARAVLTPSAAHAAWVAPMLGLDEAALGARVVPPGRDFTLERRPPIAMEEGGTLRIGVWGHLNPLKGADLVLDAVRRLEDPQRVEVHLAGGETDAAFAARLRREAQGLRVFFHGAYDAMELDGHPAGDVHLVVSGSRARESWGLVVDEALVLGRPLVLPRAGAFVERADGRGFARLYRQADPVDLARVLSELLADPDTLVRMNAALPKWEDVARRTDATVDATLAIYEEVARAGPPEVPAADWWRDGLLERELEEWDRRLSASTGEELGFE